MIPSEFLFATDKTYLYFFTISSIIFVIYFVNIYVELVNLKYNVIPNLKEEQRKEFNHLKRNIELARVSIFKIYKNILKLKGSNYRNINKDNIGDIDLSYSKIKLCIIDNKIITESKFLYYNKILIDIYTLIKYDDILKYTTFNIKESEYNKNGYKWCDELGLSIQGKSSKDTVLEYINMINIMKIDFYIEIQLSNDEIIKIEYEY
mgnify:CR=1 FL=1